MDDSPLADLRKRLRENQEEEARLRTEYKRARRREVDRRAAAAREWSLTESLLHTVLIMYVLADNAVEPSIVFLRQRARQRHWPERSDEDIGSLVEDAFLAADVDALASLSDLDNPSDSAALAAALDYVEQWRVQAWTEARNRLGTAVPTRDVLSQFQERQAALPLALRPRAWGTSEMGSARMRLTRWRQRWGGRVTSLRPREVLPQDVMQEKVRRVRGSTLSDVQMPMHPPEVGGWVGVWVGGREGGVQHGRSAG